MIGINITAQQNDDVRHERNFGVFDACSTRRQKSTSEVQNVFS